MNNYPLQRFFDIHQKVSNPSGLKRSGAVFSINVDFWPILGKIKNPKKAKNCHFLAVFGNLNKIRSKNFVNFFFKISIKMFYITFPRWFI